MAHDIAMEQLTSVQDDYDVPMGIASLRDSPSHLPQLIECLTQHEVERQYPWRNGDEAISRRHAVHFFTQFAPMALVDGYWVARGILDPKTEIQPLQLAVLFRYRRAP